MGRGRRAMGWRGPRTMRACNRQTNRLSRRLDELQESSGHREIRRRISAC